MAKIRICKEEGCSNAQTTVGFCRLHYLKNWKSIQQEKRKKAAKNLNRYVESILKQHPERYMDIIKKDIRSKKFEEFIENQFGSLEEAEDFFNNPEYDNDIDSILDQLDFDKDF